MDLYGNSKEPRLPFDLVRGDLDWVREMFEDNWDEWENFPDRLITLVLSRP
jgi:hypothetical protein